MIELWHGGARWYGTPEIQEPRSGRYECGPGLYLTTSYSRAREYAKGPKVVTRVSLTDDIRWLEDARLPLDTLTHYVENAYRMRNKKQVLSDLRNAGRRDGEQLPVSYLVNLCVNYDCLAGKQGLLLAKWLAEQGIDASLYKRSASEHWVVVFNPKVIARSNVVPAAEVSLDDYNLPLIELPN